MSTSWWLLFNWECAQIGIKCWKLKLDNNKCIKAMATKAMLGLVNAAYWREPTKLRDWVGSKRGEAVEMHKVEEEETGDGTRLWIRREI